MEIRIYEPVTAASPNFVRVGITRVAVSSTLTQHLWSPGDFTLTIPFEARYAAEMTEDRLLLIDRAFAGIIDAITLETTEQGQMLTVSGRDLKGIVAQRITIPPQASGVQGAQGYDAAAGTTETIIKHYIDTNMVTTPLQPARAVPGLVIALDQGRGIADDKYITRHDPLDGVLQDLCQASGLGYDIKPDFETSQYVFDVIQGVDRSGIQSDRPRIVFDVSRKTAQSQTYSRSTRDARNVFYATVSGSEFADEALTLAYVRDGETEQAGLQRREQHLDISADTPAVGSEYDELKRYALIEAENYLPAESFECVIMDNRWRYGIDYTLGDIVTVQNAAWGITMHTQLISMVTEHSESGITHTATFGKAPLTVFGRLRRQIRQGG